MDRIQLKLFYFREIYILMLGKADSLVGKVVSMQAQGLEFQLPETMLKSLTQL